MTATQDINTLSNPPLLEKIDRLRDLNIGQHVPLPQVSPEVSYLVRFYMGSQMK